MSANAAGTLQEQQDIYMESTKAHLQQLRTEAERTYDILFDTDTVNGFTDSLTNMLTVFNNFLEGIGGGTNAIAFFGATVANIFSKQIGASIEQQIENLEAFKANADAISLKEKVSSDILNYHQSKGESIGSTGIQAEAEIAQKLLNIRQNLSNEEYNELTNLQHKIGLDTERLAYLEEYKNISMDLFGTEKASIAQYENLLNQESENLRIEEEINAQIDRELRLRQAGAEVAIKDNSALESRLRQLMACAETEEELSLLQEANRKVINGDKLEREEIAQIIKSQNTYLEKQRELVNDIKQGLEGRKAAENNVTTALKEQINAENKIVDNTVALKEREKLISNGVKGLTSLLSVTTAISGMIKTIDDKELSTWEKFTRVLTSSVFILPQVISLFKNFNSILPMIGTGIKSATTAITGLDIAAAPVVLTILAIVAAIAALSAVIKEIDSRQNQYNRALDEASEAAEKANKELNKTKEAYENLKSSIENYDKMKSALDDLTEGTVEWKKQVIDLNNEVLKLLETYPELSEYLSKSDNGILSISKKGYDELLDKQLEKYKQNQNYSLVSKIEEINAKNDASADILRRELKEAFSIMPLEDIRSLAKVISDNQDLIKTGYNNDDIIRLLEQSNINLEESVKNYNAIDKNRQTSVEKSISAIISNNDALVQYGNNIKTYSDQIGIYTNEITKNKIEDNPNYKESDYKDLIIGQGDKITEGRLSSARNKVSEMSNEEIAQEYKKLFGEGKNQIYRDSKNNWANLISPVMVANGVSKTKRMLEGKLSFGEMINPVKEIDYGGFYFTDSEKKKSKENYITDKEAREKIASYYALEAEDAEADFQKTVTEKSKEIDKLMNDLNWAVIENFEDKAKEAANSGRVIAEYEDRVLNEPENKGPWMGEVGELSDLFSNFANREMRHSEEAEETDLTKALYAIYQGKNLNELYTKDQLKGIQGNWDQIFKDDELKSRITELFGEDFLEKFTTGLENVLDNYSYKKYYGGEGQDFVGQSKKSLKEADKIGEISSILSYGDSSKLNKEQIEYLDELKEKYVELSEIQDKTSHEYLDMLRQIKEQEEDNANTALQTAKEMQEKDLDNLFEQLDRLKEENAPEIEIVAVTDQIEEVLNELENTEREIKVKIDADLASDVDDAFGLSHEFDRLRDLVTDDLKYTVEDAQKIIGMGYGEIFTNAKKTANGMIQVDKSVRDAVIDSRQKELNADKKTRVTELQNQRKMLVSQRDILTKKLNALNIALNAETEADAQASLAKVENLEGEYQAELQKMNETLTKSKQEAESEEKIDESLYNSLGGMYDQDLANQTNAAAAAADNDKANADARIQNAKAIYEAYRSVARQVAASANGQETSFTAGATTGGTTVAAASSQKVSGTGINTGGLVGSLLGGGSSLNLSSLITNGKTNQTYKNTINALIKSTTAQLNSVNAQIGSIDAAIASLESSKANLDKQQKASKAGGNGGKGSGGKGGKGKGNGGKGKGKGGKGSGSGSGSEADQMELLDEEEDRYHEVDVQLKLIENDLEKLEKVKEKAFGKDQIELLNKELEKYDQKINELNNKMTIAIGEAVELRQQLKTQGVKFGEDGTVSNYVAAIQAQENAVNKIINNYNKKSKSAQESYKETVEQAKANFEEFKKNIDRYDEIVSSLIPELEQNIQDAIDAQVDIQIEEFDMEIEIRLKLKDAEQDWNEFRKNVLEDFKDKESLGDLFKDYEDLKTLLAEDENGLAQSLTRQLKNTLDELHDLDEDGYSYVYGENRSKALEDLKNYLDESIKALEEIEKLEESIHKDFISNMDDIQKRFDKQVKEYDTLSKLLNHDKKVIELISGKDAYQQLTEYYDKQEKNYADQLAFQDQQVKFWKEQMEVLDETSDEWKDAKDKWKDAVEDYNKLIEDSINNLQDKYLNTIKSIFDDLNNKLSGDRGLKGMNDQWKLLNMQSSEYLDNINGIYKTQELANKYLEAIDNTSNIKAQQRLKDIMDDELEALRNKDQLSEYDLKRAELRYQIAIKQIALEEAQQNKNKMRLRRDTQGNYRYEYVADEDQVNKTKQELSDFYNQLYNLDAKKYSENLEKVYNLTKEAEDKIQDLYEDTTLTNEERQERILEITEYYNELINQLTADNEYIKLNLQESTMSELFDLYDVNKDNYADMTDSQKVILERYLKDSEDLTNAAYDNLFNVYNENIENFKNMTDEEVNILMNELIPGWDSAYQQMIDSLNAEGGFIEATKQAYAECEVAAENYYTKVMELAGQSTEANQQAIDTVNELREANEQVLEVARQEMEEGIKYLEYLEDLKKAREADAAAAKAQTKAAYEYWQEQQRQAAEAAKKEAEKKKAENEKKKEAAKTTTTTTTATASTSSGSSSGSSKSGDGKLTVGDKATYTGKYYYDSYGKSPAGSKYAGVKNGIVVDKINSNPYGIHIKSSDGKYNDLGWVKKSQLSGYDTGGYTGTWGKDGRLALLHQKELVLNATDTKNMLDAVKIIRNITDTMGTTLLNRIADISSANVGNILSNSGQIEQRVQIDATFPNVTNHNEIEEALNNLVNAAAQRVNSLK